MVQKAGRASFELLVPLSTFARGLARARTMAMTSATGIGAVLGGGIAAGFRLAQAAVLRFGGFLRGFLARLKAGLMGFGGIGAFIGIAGAGFAAVKTIQTFATFENAMARVKALSGATGEEFKSLEGLARELGKATQFTATQAAEAMGYFALQGMTVNEILKATEPTLDLAIAGQLDMATAANISGNVLKGMRMSVEDLPHVLDVLGKALTTANTDVVQLGEAFKMMGPVGASAGQSVETLTTMAQFLADAGMPGGQGGTAIRNILLRMMTGVEGASKAMKTLGVSMVDDEGKIRDVVDVFDDLREALAKVTPLKRAEYMQSIAGTRAYAALDVILGQGTERLRAYRARLEDANGTNKKIREEMEKTLLAAWRRFTAAIDEAQILIGAKLRPALAALFNQLALFAPVIGEWINNTLSPLFEWATVKMSVWAKKLTGFLEGNMPTFKTWGAYIMTIVSNVWNYISSFFSWVSGGGGTFAENVMASITKLLDYVSLVTTDPAAGWRMLAKDIEAIWHNLTATIIETSLRMWTAISEMGSRAMSDTLFKTVKSASGGLLLGHMIDPALKLTMGQLGITPGNPDLTFAEVMQNLAASQRREGGMASLTARNIGRSINDKRDENLKNALSDVSKVTSQIPALELGGTPREEMPPMPPIELSDGTMDDLAEKTSEKDKGMTTLQEYLQDIQSKLFGGDTQKKIERNTDKIAKGIDKLNTKADASPIAKQYTAIFGT